MEMLVGWRVDEAELPRKGFRGALRVHGLKGARRGLCSISSEYTDFQEFVKR